MVAVEPCHFSGFCKVRFITNQGGQQRGSGNQRILLLSSARIFSNEDSCLCVRVYETNRSAGGGGGGVRWWFRSGRHVRVKGQV